MKQFTYLTLLLVMSTVEAFSNVSLPAIFSDNMVLQRNADVKIWGWAKPGEVVKLTTSWSSDTLQTKVGKNGTWELFLPTPDVREPQEITLTGYNTVILQNVLLGEVWLVSGQSNMEWSAAAGIDNAAEAIAGAENDQIRFFTVLNRSAPYPQQDLDGEWVASTPETMKHFSAVAYFFGRKLNEELNVPVGLINSSWGGTPAEVWMPAEVIVENEELSKAAAMLPDVEWGPRKPGALYNAMIAPLTSFNIAGVLWYQGESNTDNADHYEQIFSALINSWRQKWNSKLPFYYAQIAPYDYGDNFAGVKVRDAQRRVLKMPKTGMVMTSDIGDIEEIHPRNKKDVGLRFANLALNEIYEKETAAYFPLFERVEKKKDKLQIYFANAEELRVDRQNSGSQFEVAGEDGEFQTVAMKVNKDFVELNIEKIENPTQVRYSWRNTGTSNIFNKAGLPASSFLEGIQK
ncbi:sialate O-acetylesterase [Salinimicrobium sp. TH3]|uniref:sialate O-acetylesterase n=1 Tax=Salinimicrobium sp. TH3 TaxID=2997342 RepID=UPI0022725854|nr:sialate O-acetylesterase [Salinimicrobium sp. TH3]MCY2685527.1 sialate O-acetylesterase [Salinimicrobium sp. TH3]